MKIATFPLLTLVVVLAIAPAAFAGAATPAEREEAGKLFWLIVFGPVLIMLMALPLAIVCRASTGLSRRISNTLAEQPGAALLIGAANLVLLAILGWAGEQVEIIGIVAAVFLMALAVAIFIGLAGVADLLGRRLFGNGPRGETVGAFTLGWLVLSGITLVPIVGFVAHLWFAAKGVGAVVLSLGGEKDAAPVSANE